MAMDVGDAQLKLTGDTKNLDQALDQVQSKTEQAMKKMQGSMRAAGIAFTAVGAVGLAMVSSARKMNAQLMQTGITIGATTKEMRNLALSTTNVTFPLESVTKTFELLARAGVRDQKVLKSTATAFDTLGDAIGVPAELVTTQLIPTMKTFNVSATDMAEKTDALTYLFKRTTVSLADFNRMVGYVTPDLVEMGLTTEDMIGILAELEKQGYSGEVMTREFRKAVTLATKEQIPLNEALGISTETIELYKEELEGATGLTQEYADAANTQYGIVDKLKQAWSEFTFKIGSMLQPLEGVLAVMTAIGPVMIIMSTQAGINAARFATSTIALIAHRVAMVAATGATIVLTAATTVFNFVLGATLGPIGLVLAALGLFVAAVYGVARAFGLTRKPIEELPRYTEESVNRVRVQAEEMLKAITRATMDTADEERRILNERLETARDVHKDRIDLINEQYRTELKLLKIWEGEEIAALQSEMDLIDEGLQARRESIQDREDEERAAELRAAIALEEDAEKRESLVEQLNKHLERMMTTKLQREARIAKDALREEIEGVRTAFEHERDLAAERLEGKQIEADKTLEIATDLIEDERIALEDKLKEDMRRIEDTTIAVREADAEKLLSLHIRLREEYEAFRQFNKDLEAMPPAILRAPIIPAPYWGGEITPERPFPPIGELEGLQRGGIVMRPMIARLAERGPEAVIPLGRAGSMQTVNITINEPVFRNEEDIDLMADKMVNAIRQRTGVNI